MTTQTAMADTSTKTVTFGGKTYKIQALGDDSYTVLLEGIPVGRILDIRETSALLRIVIVRPYFELHRLTTVAVLAGEQPWNGER